MKRYENVTTHFPTRTISEPDYYRRTEPAHPQHVSVTAGVLVPLLQTLVTSVLWVILVAAGVSLTASYTVYRPDGWLIALSVFSLASLAQWQSLLAEWRSLLWPETTVEATTTAPLMPVAPLERPVVRVELAAADGRSLAISELPGTTMQLSALAAGLVEGKSLAESAWVGNDNVFNRGEFVALRDELIRRGFAEWVSEGNPARGSRLTRAGNALMKHLANQPPSQAANIALN